MARIGERIGTYEITRLLGSGGMAMVYAARHTSLGTNHALKVLLPNYASQPRTVERFRQEARAQFRMRHPNIVQVTDFVEDGDNLALVMDLIDGITLGEAMQRKPGPWPVDDVVAVMRPVLQAMAYAHRDGMDGTSIVHRDLKPENVMLDLGAQRIWPGIPKVTDFGIAKVLGGANLATATNARMGTPGYMSPEQFKNAKDTNAATDVWALGVMTWQLLAGRMPVDPENSLALVKWYEGLTPVPPIAVVAPNVPVALSEAVAQAMVLEPGKRFANAGPLLRAIEIALVLRGSRPPEVQSDDLPPPLPPRQAAKVTPPAAPVAGAAEPDQPETSAVTPAVAPESLALATDHVAKVAEAAEEPASAETPAETVDGEHNTTAPQAPNASIAWRPKNVFALLAALGVAAVVAFAGGRGTWPGADNEATETQPQAAAQPPHVAAPPGRSLAISGPYEIDAAAGIVTDTRTHLVWQWTAGAASTWSSASHQCEALRLENLTWRLPRKAELLGLVDKSRQPAVDLTAFAVAGGGSSAAQDTWSGTPCASCGTGWHVHVDGAVGLASAAPDDSTFWVRCVSGQVDVTEPELVLPQPPPAQVPPLAEAATPADSAPTTPAPVALANSEPAALPSIPQADIDVAPERPAKSPRKDALAARAEPAPAASKQATTRAPTAKPEHELVEKPVHLGIPKLSFPGISASRRKQAIQTNSDGVMMLKSGDHAEAVAYFVRALQLDPGYVFARYNLACAYALSGDAKRAVAVLAQFRDCDREDCQRRLARARTDEDFRDCWSRPDFIKVTAPNDN